MRRLLLSSVVLFAVACGASPQSAQSPSAVAQDAKRQAERGEVGVTPETGATSTVTIACGDTVLNDQAHSGTEQLTEFVPCTTVEPVQTPAKPMPATEPDPSQAVPAPPIAADRPLPPLNPSKEAVTPASKPKK
jgi:hypothetical protein